MTEYIKKLFNDLFNDLYEKVRQDYKSAFITFMFVFLSAVFWVFYSTDSHWQKRYDNQTNRYDSLQESFFRMKVEYQVELDTCQEQRSTFQLNLYYENKKELDKLREELYRLTKKR